MTIKADHSTDTYTAARLAELEKEIPMIDAAMEDVRHRIEQFVELHPQQRTAFANGLLVGRIGAMELRHPYLRALESELDNLVTRWHATLGEYAALKQKRRQG
jgi:hypothetical protein